MEKLDKKIFKNGLKKGYVVLDEIQPKFSAIHTKLCTDGMNLSQEQMYLLGNGYAREIFDDNLIMFNNMFLNDLSSCLGIYLEDYEENDEQMFFESVKKNSAINIAPPMIFVKYEKVDYLSIVCKVFDDHSYDVISPIEKIIIHVTKEDVMYDKPWYMMNSPRFINPVFRNFKQLIDEAVYRLQQKYGLIKTSDYQKIFELDTDLVCKKASKELSKEMIEDRLLYCNAMRMITKKEATVILLHEYNSILKSLELLTESIGEDEKKYSLLKRLFLIEDQIIKGLSVLGIGEKGM